MPVKYGDGGMSAVFSDDRHGWFEETGAGHAQLPGELFATSDSGTTWQLAATTDRQGSLPCVEQLTIQKDGALWLSGGQMPAGPQYPGFVWFFKSKDGGKTWSQVDLPLSAAHRQETTSVSAPMFFGQDGFVEVCFSPDSSSLPGDAVLYASQDGGRTWAVRSALNQDSWLGFRDATFGWQTSGNQVYVTKDGGRSWQPLPASDKLQKLLADYAFSQVDFVNSQHGWLRLIKRNCDGDTLLLVSNDGGQTWNELTKTP